MKAVIMKKEYIKPCIGIMAINIEHDLQAGSPYTDTTGPKGDHVEGGPTTGDGQQSGGGPGAPENNGYDIWGNEW